MPAGIAPFFKFQVVRDDDVGRNIINWRLVPDVDVTDIEIYKDPGTGFVLLDTIDLSAISVNRHIDGEGEATDQYHLVALDSLGDPYPATEDKLPTTEDVLLCTITGTVLNPDGSPHFDAKVFFEGWVPPGQLETKEAVVKTKVETTTDAGGVFALDIIQGLVGRLEIPEADYSRPILVPELASVDYAEIERISGPMSR